MPKVLMIVVAGPVALLLGCAPSESAGAPVPAVTVTETVTAQPDINPEATPLSVDDLSTDQTRLLDNACTAVTQYYIIDAFADEVYFREFVSPMMQVQVDYLVAVYARGANLNGWVDIDALPAEWKVAAKAFEEDSADAYEWASALEAASDYYEWYDTWMTMVDNPSDFDSVHEILALLKWSSCSVSPYASSYESTFSDL